MAERHNLDSSPLLWILLHLTAPALTTTIRDAERNVEAAHLLLTRLTLQPDRHRITAADEGVVQQSPGEDSRTDPKDYLFGWEQILSALGKKDTAKTRDQVRNANKGFEGPIKNKGRGSRPFVDKGKLLTWWNSLEERYTESEQAEEDKRATVEAKYRYGRSGAEVVPGIDGYVKRRRKDRKA
jgi:hypothetical protein